jgi:hypothetical protein
MKKRTVAKNGLGLLDNLDGAIGGSGRRRGQCSLRLHSMWCVVCAMPLRRDQMSGAGAASVAVGPESTESFEMLNACMQPIDSWRRQTTWSLSTCPRLFSRRAPSSLSLLGFYFFLAAPALGMATSAASGSNRSSDLEFDDDLEFGVEDDALLMDSQSPSDSDGRAASESAASSQHKSAVGSVAATTNKSPRPRISYFR